MIFQSKCRQRSDLLRYLLSAIWKIFFHPAKFETYYGQLVRTVFYVMGNIFLKNLFKYWSVRTKKLHKVKFNKKLFFQKSIMIFKLELSPQNGRYTPLLLDENKFFMIYAKT